MSSAWLAARAGRVIESLELVQEGQLVVVRRELNHQPVLDVERHRLAAVAVRLDDPRVKLPERRRSRGAVERNAAATEVTAAGTGGVGGNLNIGKICCGAAAFVEVKLTI